MSNNLRSELLKKFQLERLILFSDAVFAIAITFPATLIIFSFVYTRWFYIAFSIPSLIPFSMKFSFFGMKKKIIAESENKIT